MTASDRSLSGYLLGLKGHPPARLVAIVHVAEHLGFDVQLPRLALAVEPVVGIDPDEHIINSLPTRRIDEVVTVGASTLLFVGGILRFAYDLEEVFTDETLRRLGVFTDAFAFTYMLEVFYEIQTETFAGDMADPNVSLLVFQGSIAPSLWLAIAGVVIPTIYLVVQQASSRFTLIGTVPFAGVMIVAVFQ